MATTEWREKLLRVIVPPWVWGVFVAVELAAFAVGLATADVSASIFCGLGVLIFSLFGVHSLQQRRRRQARRPCRTTRRWP